MKVMEGKELITYEELIDEMVKYGDMEEERLECFIVITI